MDSATKPIIDAFNHFVENVYPNISNKPKSIRDAVSKFKRGRSISIKKMEQILKDHNYIIDTPLSFKYPD